MGAAGDGPVVYAVPGSPRVGEFAVPEMMHLADVRGIDVVVIDAASFVDAICAHFGVDPLRDGLLILDGRSLPDPLVIQTPTVIAHIDVPAALAEAAARLSDVAGPDSTMALVVDAGAPTASVWRGHPDQVDPALAGVRASIFLEPGFGGLADVIETMRRLRRECPWDRAQTHHSIIPNLIEEAHELADALAALPPAAPAGAELDTAYPDVEDELGDLLLQILFHVAMGEDHGGLRLDRIAETLRQKLIRRHPHVFGDAAASTADEVRSLWDEAKAAEAPASGSVMSDPPGGLPSLNAAAAVSQRAASVGFDWTDVHHVLAKLDEEIAELREALAGDGTEEQAHELGDVLFTLVNVGRHLAVDADVALRAAIGRFRDRFERMEAGGPLRGLSSAELDNRWQAAKERGG